MGNTRDPTGNVQRRRTTRRAKDHTPTATTPNPRTPTTTADALKNGFRLDFRPQLADLYFTGNYIRHPGLLVNTYS